LSVPDEGYSRNASCALNVEQDTSKLYPTNRLGIAELRNKKEKKKKKKRIAE
jgi:hypothetical protein